MRGQLAKHERQYEAFVLFGAYTGQHSMATMASLTVDQFRNALEDVNQCWTSRPSRTKSGWNIISRRTLL